MVDDGRRLGFTSARDLLLIAGVALVVAYVLVRIAYGSLPVFPRLAGISAAVLGVGEALAGSNIRARLAAARRPDQVPAGRPPERVRSGIWGDLRPVPPLVGARALMIAKASSLAGAGLAGLWAGLLLYVVPRSGEVVAAGTDTATGLIGIVCALTLTGGALWLERCCARPDDPGPTG